MVSENVLKEKVETMIDDKVKILNVELEDTVVLDWKPIVGLGRHVGLGYQAFAEISMSLL